MDNLAYLNQISQSNRPTKRNNPTSPLKDPKFLVKLAIGGIVLLCVVIAFSVLLCNKGNRSRSLTEQVYVRSTNLTSVLQEFTPDIKSSRLRAIGYSLSTVLSNGTSQLSAYLTKSDEGDDAKELITDTKMNDSELAMLQELQISLTNSKLNGILDRTYETQITLQVSLLLALTSQLLERSDDAELTNIITSLHSSLQTIHENLENYSNPSS